MRITRVYTRSGDGGETRLGGGQKVRKDSPRIAAFGTVDELNSSLGVCLAAPLDERLASIAARIQNELFFLGADLCLLEADRKSYPTPRVEQRHIDALERDIDALMAALSPLEEFILPGGAPGSAHLHVARTICRRAERLVVSAGREEPVGELSIAYLNRLSDLLFVMARYENKAKGVPEPQWRKETPARPQKDG